MPFPATGDQMVTETEIPKQFRAEGYRFVKLGRSGEALKKPFEYFWESLTLEDARRQYAQALADAGGDKSKSKKLQAGEPTKLTNYAFDDPILLQHLGRGLNYGVVNGTGPNGAGLVTLDADNLPRLAELVDLSLLPQTLVTGRRGEDGEPIPERRHFHFLSNLKGKHILSDPETGKDLGDVRGTGGFQVVGPGSLHPSGARVEVLADRPVMSIDDADLLRVLAPVLVGKMKIRPGETAREAKKRPTATDGPLGGVSILDVIDTSGFKESGGQYFGKHPIHGSETGHNLVVNPTKNTWWCGRCESGGGPAHWLAVEASIIKCSEATTGALRGMTFCRVLDYARGRGIIAAEVLQEAEPKFTLSDFGELTPIKVKKVDPATGEQKTVNDTKFIFLRHKAAESISEKMHLVMTPSSKEIYYFDGEIFSPKGEAVIKNTIYSICDSYVDRSAANEVLDRVRAELAIQPVDLRPEPHLMPLTNGVFDLKIGELVKYSPDHKFTFKYNARWDPEGGDWQRILWHLCSSLPDPRAVLQAIDVMTATAIRIPFDAWILLIGSGNNGKGMFERLLLNFVTPERASALTIDELKKSQFAGGHLLNSDLLIISEVENVKDANSILKKLATGEFMDSDVKYGGRVKGLPHLMMILDANNAFEYGDDSFGRKRRTIKQDWPYRFGDGPTERPMDRMTEEVFRSEGVMSGVAWIVAARAPALLRTRKIYSYKTAEQMDDEFDRQRNSLHYFTEECLGTVESTCEWLVNPDGPKGGSHTKLTNTWAYKQYLEWCAYFNVPTTASQTHLTSYIKKKFGTKVKKTSTSVEGDKQDIKYFERVGLVKTPAEAFSDYLLANNYTADDSIFTALNSDITPLIPSITPPISREIDSSNCFTPFTQVTAGFMEEIIGEIKSMFSFIKSCEISPRKISFENFLENGGVSGVSGVNDRSMAENFTPLPKNDGVKSPEECRKKDGDYQHISENLKEAERRQAEKDEKFKTPGPNPSEETCEIFGLPISYFEDLSIQTNGLTTKILMQAQKWDDLKAGMALNSLQSRGWAEDDKGRLHPPGERDRL
jgi:phage/plasmid-associated DNA primase